MNITHKAHRRATARRDERKIIAPCGKEQLIKDPLIERPIGWIKYRQRNFTNATFIVIPLYHPTHHLRAHKTFWVIELKSTYAKPH